MWCRCRRFGPRRNGLQQGSADTSSRNHNANASPNCGGKPQEDIFTPEIGPPRDGSSSCAPRSDKPHDYPKHCTQQYGHGVRTRISDRGPNEQQPGSRDHRSNEARYGTLSTSAEQQNKKRDNTDNRRRCQRSKRPGDKDASPVPAGPARHRCCCRNGFAL